MQITIDVITTRQEILKALAESQVSQSIIGITSPDLGPGMFMTSVKEIRNEAEDVLIVLNSYDTTGYFLEKNKISLGSITGVIPFKAAFTNPFLKEVQGDAEKKNPDYIF